MKNKQFGFAFDMRMSAAEQAEIMVYGDIVSWKWSDDDPEITAKEFDKLLKEAKQKGAKQLHLRINSPGGSVFQAVAMRAMLLDSGFEQIDVSIEGLCASAATLFVCLPDVHVRIAEGSSFMIHNPYTWASGTAAELEKQVDIMRNMETDMCMIYHKRTGRSKYDIRDWMDAETWFTAQEAVDAGFCDEVLEMAEAAACASGETVQLMHDVYQHVPEGFTMKARENISNAEPEAVTGDASEITKSTKGKDEYTMEINEITKETLASGNAEVYAQVLAAGAEAERARMQLIDDMTPPGYEQLAKQAKADGADGVAYAKMLAEAQRKKGADFLSERKAEVQAAAEVKGGNSGDHDPKNEAGEMDKYKAELKQLAAEMHFESKSNTMF